MGESAAAPHYAQVVPKPPLVALALAFCIDAAAQERAFVPLSVSPLPRAASRALPPLPFRYIGRLRVDGRTEVLLMRGSAVYSVVPGSQIDGEYRVDRVTDSTISFTYLPLRATQDMNL